MTGSCLAERIPDSRSTVFVVHTPDANIGHQLHLARALYERCDCNVFILEYPGFGAGGSIPSLPKLVGACEKAIAFLFSCDKIDTSKVILYGQGIGTAVVSELALPL